MRVVIMILGIGLLAWLQGSHVTEESANIMATLLAFGLVWAAVMDLLEAFKTKKQ